MKCLGTHNGQNPVDPAISNAHNHESKQERRNWHTDSHHQRPVTHASGSVLLEERLGNDGTAHRCGGTNEEGRDGPAQTHRRVGVTIRTADISDHRTEQRDQKDGPTAETIAQGAPEEGCAAQHGDEEGDQVAGSLHADAEVFGDVDECGLDGCCGEETDHGVEDDQR